MKTNIILKSLGFVGIAVLIIAMGSGEVTEYPAGITSDGASMDLQLTEVDNKGESFRFDPTMLNIGREKQLLVDNMLIESAENITRTWHKPQKVEKSPLIKRDRPWEHIPYFSCNTWQVIRDPKDGLFKCWYTDWYKPEIKPGEMATGDSKFNLLYAESKDGIHWKKPELDISLVDGQRTNIVLPNAYNPGIILDLNETDSKRRYKMVFTQFLLGVDVADATAAVSADGIHWQILDETLQIGHHGSRLDDVIIMDQDPYTGIYLMTTRHYDMYAIARNLNTPFIDHWTPVYYPMDWARTNKRRVWESESKDLIHWSEPRLILSPGKADGLDETFYGLCKYRVGSITMGFLNTMSYVTNTMNVRLVYSRDGREWAHLHKRQPFLYPGGEGSWDEFMVTIPSKPIEVDDELYIFHGGSLNHHDWWITGAREGVQAEEAYDISKVSYGLGLAKLRLDGFASLDAGIARPGILVTRPFISEGTKLVINARCGEGGSIEAEILDVYDQPLRGFAKSDCDKFTDDNISHMITWNGNGDISQAETERAKYPHAERGRLRKIRFYMHNAQLYSFTMQ